MKKILLSTLCTLSLGALAQSSIQLVKQFSSYNNYSNLAVLNNKLILQGKSSAEGAELWTSDGSATGTNLLVDLLPGSSSASPRFFKNALGKVLFVAYGPSFVNQLFITDGTAVGTFSLCNLNSSPDVINSIPLGKEVNNKFYFCNNSSSEGNELWVTDGTVNGTQLVKDINAGSNSGTPANFEVLGNNLFFTANDGTTGIELWKSDGSPAGTTLVKDIVSGSANSEITEIKAYNNKLYFAAGTDTELWYSDGTNAGTLLLKDIGSGYSSSPYSFKEFNGKLYFSAEGNSVGVELHQTDGTAIGTVLTSDIKTGTGNGLPDNFYPVNSKLYMTASTIAAGRELMVYEPSTNTVNIVKDVTAGTGNGVSAVIFPNNGSGIIPGKISNINNTVFYAASESGFSDTQIWLTDGTPAGSSKLLYSGTTYSSASQYNLTAFNNEIYFYSDYLGTNSVSLYKISGTPVGINKTLQSSIHLTLYPNPTNGIVNVYCNKDKTSLKILNMLGQCVYEISGSDSGYIIINVEHLNKGAYFLSAEYGNDKIVKKFIIQ